MLETSTASIEKQCRLLEAQKRAISDIIQRNSSNQDTQSYKKLHSGRTTHEKAQLEFEQAELSESLRNQLTAASKHAESTIAGLPATLEKILDKDDRLLDGLEKVIPKLASADDAAANLDEVDRLCKALTQQLSLDIRSQIDETYRSAAQSDNVYTNGTHNNSDTKDNKAQREALESELEELCREIDGLSSMAVENQYRIPISRALSASREDIEAEKAAWSDYVAAILQHLTARLETLNDQFEHAHAHNSALKSVSSAFESVMATVVDRKPAQAAIAALRGSPSKQSQKGLKPLRLVQANLSENQDPVVQVLKGLDVRVPSERDNPGRLAENLDTAVKEQLQKLSAFSSTTERNIADQIAQSLGKVERDSKALSGAVFGESEFGTIRLLRSEVQGLVDGLEEKTQRTGDEMRGLDITEIARELREKQKAVIEKLQT